MLILMTLQLGACATMGDGQPKREPVTRNLPDPPSYLQPAPVPPAPVGADPFVVSEQRKQVIVSQNKVIVGARSAWVKMKSTYQKSFLKRNVFGR